ncbi:helix-turn-helix domain-containing protein [Maribacter sp. 2307ULW6-5]|uniref:helix-turn-helix domain-containing protein n=1 Tax=Maribacter sp. 2307ULW6-5 TaxID=3386275 RepID=UPI0039BCBFF0
MKLEFKNTLEESSIILTDFNCGPAQNLLQDSGYYKIVWARDREFSLTVDGYAVQLKQHQVLFCTTLNLLQVPKESGLIALVFNREFYCIRDHDHEVSCNGILFFGSSQPPIVSLAQKDIRSFEAMFTIFREEFETVDHIQGEMLRVMLKRLLITSSRLVKEMQKISQLPNTQLELLRNFHVLVEQHFKEKHKVADYAALLYKSPKTLSNVFKKAGRPSPLAIINERILLEAKRLLLNSHLSAEQIAHALGYEEGAHFSKFFKSHTGLPPVEYRAKKTKTAQA